MSQAAPAHFEEIFRTLLPFAPTGAQIRVLGELADDLKSAKPMHRLLQGDVGSGKTGVALASAVAVAEAGFQVLFIAPTELLAEQHAANAERAIEAWNRAHPERLPLKTALMIGQKKGKARQRILEGLALGSIDIAIGTHALIQEHVIFKRLAFGIIDEQHRFGVVQRGRLHDLAKSPDAPQRCPHTLVMTATPIPRTLSMTLYGDLDVSILDEKPAERKPIETLVRGEAQRHALYKSLAHEVEKEGAQIYVVVPRISPDDEEDDNAPSEDLEQSVSQPAPEPAIDENALQLANVEEHAEWLASDPMRGCRVGKLHGRLGGAEKQEIMAQFAQGTLDVLVATTVIEVGIDVPNASRIVIEHADRFGLSQLHQLRGRVGRGQRESRCILIASERVSKDGQARLELMRSTNDGFRLSEADLKLRGAGDLLGTRQSGLPVLQIADLNRDAHILRYARSDAARIIGQDPTLSEPAHTLLRKNLAHLFAGRGQHLSAA